MKKMLLLIMLFFIPLSAQNDFLCIGLGHVCTTRAALETFNLTDAAYPFDWMISPMNGLRLTLENNFKDFLNPAYLSFRKDKHGIVNKYSLEFVHDFPSMHYTGNTVSEDDDMVENGVIRPDWLNYLPDIQTKYNRRIARFQDKCHGNKKVYFIRHFDVNRHDSCLLRDLLKRLYPHLDFTLVIVGNSHPYAIPWNEPHIKNYHLNDTTVWNDVKEWKRIFVDLGIAQATKEPLESMTERYEQALCKNCSYCMRLKSDTNATDARAL